MGKSKGEKRGYRVECHCFNCVADKRRPLSFGTATGALEYAFRRREGHSNTVDILSEGCVLLSLGRDGRQTSFYPAHVRTDASQKLIEDYILLMAVAALPFMQVQTQAYVPAHPCD